MEMETSHISCRILGANFVKSDFEPTFCVVVFSKLEIPEFMAMILISCSFDQSEIQHN